MSRTLIRKTEVGRRTGLSEATIRRLALKGEFPMPVQLTEGGSVAWYQDEVDVWIESRQIVTPESQRRVAPGNTKRGRPRLASTPPRIC
jgi:prophage regulatory protein